MTSQMASAGTARSAIPEKAYGQAAFSGSHGSLCKSLYFLCTCGCGSVQ